MTDFNMPPGVSARDIPGQDDDETGGHYPITDQWAGLAKLMAPNAVVVGAALARSLESDLAAAIDEITRLRAEVEALRAGMQWQPIETAPKTGRKVIAFYLNRNGKTRTVMARWLTDEQAAETDADGVGLEGGWYECIDNWSDYTEVAIHEGEPSHWMPLPPPPAARAKGKE